MINMIMGAIGACMLTWQMPPTERTGAMWIAIAIISAIQSNKK